jgi:hypothetical protein
MYLPQRTEKDGRQPEKNVNLPNPACFCFGGWSALGWVGARLPLASHFTLGFWAHFCIRNALLVISPFNYYMHCLVILMPRVGILNLEVLIEMAVL